MIALGLLLLVIPFVGPIASLVSLADVKRRLREVEELLEQQRAALEELKGRVRDATRVVATEARHMTAEPAPPAAADRPRPPMAVPPAASATPSPAPPSVVTPKAPPAPPITPPVAPPAPPRVARPAPPPPPLAPPVPPPPPAEPFDWERLIGVKMFSAVAGIALVFAAVFFLRYSIDQGWLGPPIRVAIGVLTGVALLVVCDLKAARRYPATANAMDAAAIAILFATFFAAHALWHLIPAAVAFGLLALVTAVAVLLSIRRDSPFIAVLGLLVPLPARHLG